MYATYTSDTYVEDVYAELVHGSSVMHVANAITWQQ